MVALMTAWTKVCASWPQQTIFPVREVIAPESNLKIINVYVKVEQKLQSRVSLFLFTTSSSVLQLEKQEPPLHLQ